MIKVALASDDGYAAQLEACAISLLENNRANKICIVILDNGISDNNLKDIIKSITDRNGSYKRIELRNIERLIGFKPPMFNNSFGLYCRIFLPRLLQDEHVIYLDSDMIVTGDILELWDTNLEGYYAAGVLDTLSNEHKVAIGLNKEDIYINSGMLVMNLEAWRKDDVDKKIIDYIREHQDGISLPDQDAINVACKGKIKVVDAKYNVMSPAYLMPYDNIVGYFNVGKYYTKDEIKEAKKSPVIIHFTGYPDVRPWEKECHHPRRAVFYKYQSRGNVALPDSHRPLMSNSRRITLFKYRYMPFRIYTSIKQILRKK